MFQVIAEGQPLDAEFNLPIAAVSRALMLSMGDTASVRVLLEGTIICIAKNGALSAEDGTELSPSQAARAADRVAKAQGR